MATNNHFLRGAVLLTWSGLAVKTLGYILVFLIMPRLIGMEGVGLYLKASPFFLTAIAIAGGGIPFAIPQLVAAAQARGKSKDPKAIPSILIAARIMGLLGSLGLVLLGIFVLPTLTPLLSKDERILHALYAVLPALPIISLAYVYRGYFQGCQDMRTHAVAQTIEQLTRVLSTVFLTLILLPYGLPWVVAGAMLGITCGELVGLLFLHRSFRHAPSRPHWKWRDIPVSEITTSFKKLWKIAFPITIRNSTRMLFYLFEMTLISLILVDYMGVEKGNATALYGIMRTTTLLLMALSFITTALSTALLPAISEAVAKGHHRSIVHRSRQAIRLALLIGIPFFILLLALAKPIALLLYPRSAEIIAHFLCILALPFGLAYHLQVPLDIILQALGGAKRTLYCTFGGLTLKTLLLPILMIYGNLGNQGMDGVVLAISLGTTTTLVLYFCSLMKIFPNLIPSYRRLLPLLGLTLATYGSAAGLWHLWAPESTSTWGILPPLLGSIVGSLSLYGILVWKLKLVRRRDIRILFNRSTPLSRATKFTA
ncbi:oligosaccharide flippase family protein [Pasteuria penetrans]|uniref:oligosaccharide flippase family protein n=1 Tax=Pasteuria penetrans TaxID=86005 RepID=UPI0011ECA32E|nr:oligosaccharide flippase family protein [Pasteuria penetrans]